LTSVVAIPRLAKWTAVEIPKMPPPTTKTEEDDAVEIYLSLMDIEVCRTGGLFPTPDGDEQRKRQSKHFGEEVGRCAVCPSTRTSLCHSRVKKWDNHP
jgi:hypothetical protein